MVQLTENKRRRRILIANFSGFRKLERLTDASSSICAGHSPPEKGVASILYPYKGGG